MKFFQVGLLIACLFSMVQSGYTEPVKGLYTTVVEIEAQSDAQLRKAAREGLATVFIRVSGHRSVLNHSEITQALRNARTYLNQFSYQTHEHEGERHLSVVLEFEEALVSKVLRRAGLPIWSADRPTVLVWLVLDDGDSKQLANPEAYQDLMQQMRSHAKRRGLALKLPLMDLEDNLALGAEQLWQLSSPAIAQASQRYQPDSILIGKLSRLTSGRWLGQWQYRFADRKIAFDGAADDLNQFIAAGFDEVANLQADVYAIVPVKTSTDGVVIELTNIDSFTDYARAIAYLESLAAVEHANLMSLKGDLLVVRLVAEGQLQQLEKAIALGKKLKQQTATSNSDYPVALSYQWLGND